MAYPVRLTMTEFVVGFLVDCDNRVVLVRKNRPEWQDGLLNGVGGKIEPGEYPYDAMVREFKEEADVLVDNWENFLTLIGNGFKVYFFVAHGLKGQLDLVKTMTDEPIETHYFTNTCPPLDLIPNLYWILPMAMYSHNYNHTQVFVKGDIA